MEQLIHDAWSLDVATAKFILPRLLVFKNWLDGDRSLPFEFVEVGEDFEVISDGEDEWDEILCSMIYAFSAVLHEDYYIMPPDAKVKYGLQLFVKYFHYLWV